MTRALMEPFHDLLRKVRDEGILSQNVRTGQTTRFLPNQHLEFDLRQGFPILTTKRRPFKAVRGELVGFFRGFTSAAEFRAIGCKVWDKNANETTAWLNSRYRMGRPDYVGRIYGAQWTDWLDWRTANTAAEVAELIGKGYSVIAEDHERQCTVLRRGINQLEDCLARLLKDPSDRRLIVSGWRPDEFDQGALAPCHMHYSLIPDPERRVLHLGVHQRSMDLFLAYNVEISAIYLSVFAKLAGYTPGTFRLTIDNAHLYESHLEAVNTLLARSHFEAPTLVLGPSISPIQEASAIQGAFARIEPDDIAVDGYEAHPNISVSMAA